MADGTAGLLDRILAKLRSEVDPDYAFVSPGPIPFASLPDPGEDLRIALITTGGLHLRGDDPFRALEERWGDTSYRLIPHQTAPEFLDLDAPYVDQKYTPSDPEVALPMTALDELHREESTGVPAPRHASFCGGILRPFPGLAGSAVRLHSLLQEDGVTAVVLLPTCSICVQSTCILARELEGRGLPTVAVTLLPELTEIVGAPRSLAIRFPFGAPAGDPGNRELQKAVVAECLDLLNGARRPGEIRRSALAWRKSPGPPG